VAVRACVRACGYEPVVSVACSDGLRCNNSTGGSPKEWRGGGVMVVMMVRAVMAVLASDDESGGD
jgi:hypothetical protein